MNTRQIFGHLKTYLLTYLVFWLGCSILLAVYGYEGSFLWLNRIRWWGGDNIMPHYTHLADGAFLSAIFAFFAVRRDKGLVINLIFCLVLVLIVINIAKKGIFPHWHRPPVVFEGREEFFYITVMRERLHAFPSGHSAAAGAMFTYFSFFAAQRRAWMGVLLGFLSILICYSRVYIGVHFVGDVLVGSLLGVALALVPLLTTYPPMRRYFDHLDEAKSRIWGIALYVVIGLTLMGSFGNLIQIYR